jgi:protein-S-isoprenylcysteine O-methyltransferase Ste14
MSGAALFSGGNLSPGEREDRTNRWGPRSVRGDRDAGGLSAGLHGKEIWTLDGDTIRWFGVTLFCRWWCAAPLASLCPWASVQRLVAIQPGHTLVTTGIYRVIRHPSYLGLLVNSLGWALVFRSGVGVLLTALTILPLLARIRAEEALLRTQFGGEYDAYCSRTSRLIPRLY